MADDSRPPPQDRPPRAAEPFRRSGPEARGERPYNPAPEYLPPQPQKPRLAVFGGSFNPVHNGHLFLAGHVLRAGLADEVLFIPAGIPPHKPTADLAPGDIRYAMLRAALAPFPEFSVSDIEIQQRDRPSYTIETLDTLRIAFPEHVLLFLMGTDCLVELHTWQRAAELVNQFSFIIYPRPGADAPMTVTLAERFGLRNALKLRAALIEAPLLPVTASEVRSCCGEGKSVAGMVPETVHAHIQQHRLYNLKTDGDAHGRQQEAGPAQTA